MGPITRTPSSREAILCLGAAPVQQRTRKPLGARQPQLLPPPLPLPWTAGLLPRRRSLRCAVPRVVIFVPEQPPHRSEYCQKHPLYRYRWPGEVNLALVHAVERNRLLQEAGHAVLVGLAVSGEPIDSLEEDLRVQRRSEFDQDVGLFVGFVPPPVGGLEVGRKVYVVSWGW